MDLRAITAPAINVVNPPVDGLWQRSVGYVTGAAGKREAAYARAVPLSCQVQALESDELKQMDGLNIQGVKRGVYLTGNVEGVDRPDAKGGDLLTFLQQTWLVVHVFETWDVAGWCKVGVVKQVAA